MLLYIDKPPKFLKTSPPVPQMTRHPRYTETGETATGDKHRAQVGLHTKRDHPVFFVCKIIPFLRQKWRVVHTKRHFPRGFVCKIIPFLQQKRRVVHTKRHFPRDFVCIFDLAAPRIWLKVHTKRHFPRDFVCNFDLTAPRIRIKVPANSGQMIGFAD